MAINNIERILLGTTADNTAVYKRQDTTAEHIHCDMQVLSEALSNVTVSGAPFSRHNIELDHEVGTDRCVKRTEGDTVVMWQRPGRDGKTPMYISEKQPEPTRNVFVVLCYDDEMLNEQVVITAFTGVDAPQEPWDPRVRDREASEKFWSEYALIPTAEELEAMKADGIC